jgi:hypothetical protein
MLIVWILIGGHVLCGVMAYGITKSVFISNCLIFKEKYGWDPEWRCWLLAIMGLLGFLIATDIRKNARVAESKLFRFRVPKELKGEMK